MDIEGSCRMMMNNVCIGLSNRLPEAGGKQFYADGFNSGRFTAGTMVLDILMVRKTKMPPLLITKIRGRIRPDAAPYFVLANGLRS